MRVAITGGAGYVGYSTLKQLAASSAVSKIDVIDNLSRSSHAIFTSGPLGPVPIEFHRTDILDGYGLDDALQNADAVLHLAAHATTPQSDIGHHTFDQVNNWGTAQVVRAVEKFSRAKKFVYLSSFAVYGTSDSPINESEREEPSSAYGISKLAGEAYVKRLESDSCQAVVFRAGNVFGLNPAARFDAAVNQMALQACTEGKIQIHGDGEQTRPFIDVDTLAKALLTCIESDVPSGTYNVASHNASINDIAAILSDSVPHLERVFLHRDARMKQVQVDLPTKFETDFGLDYPDFEQSVARLVEQISNWTA